MIAKLREYRKGVVAVVGAAVTVAQLSGVPLAEDVPNAVMVVFDSVVALLVILLPNEQ